MTYPFKFNLISEGDWNIYYMLVMSGNYWGKGDGDWCYLEECPLPIEEAVIKCWN